MTERQEDFRRNIENIDLRDQSTHNALLDRQLSKYELKLLLIRIKREISTEHSPEMAAVLKGLRKQLKSKYSISISNNIISKFLQSTSCRLLHNQALTFTGIDREIKSSVQQINKKKYFLDKKLQDTKQKKPCSQERKKRRNVLYSTVSIMPTIKTITNLDAMFIKEKLFILKEYINEEEMKKMEEELLKKIEAIHSSKYGCYTEKIKNYTVYDSVLQKIFNLIQEDTKNIDIRKRYQRLYKKMKEQMVDIVTNQDEVKSAIRMIMTPSTKQPCASNKQNKSMPKKNYYQLQKDKQDLTAQIEDTIETAKKAIKQALIKRGRPDYAYEIELSLGNRITPFSRSRGAS